MNEYTIKGKIIEFAYNTIIASDEYEINKWQMVIEDDKGSKIAFDTRYHHLCNKNIDDMVEVRYTMNVERYTIKNGQPTDRDSIEEYQCLKGDEYRYRTILTVMDIKSVRV